MNERLSQQSEYKPAEPHPAVQAKEFGHVDWETTKKQAYNVLGRRNIIALASVLNARVADILEHMLRNPELIGSVLNDTNRLPNYVWQRRAAIALHDEGVPRRRYDVAKRIVKLKQGAGMETTLENEEKYLRNSPDVREILGIEG